MEELEDGELPIIGEEAGVDKSMSFAMKSSTTSDASSINAVAPMFAYRASKPVKALIASSDEDQSSDSDSDDENCHLKGPAKKMRGKNYSAQRMSAPAFTAEQAANWHNSDFFKQQQNQPTTAVPEVAPTAPAAPARKPKKINNIWASVIGEQSLTEDIGTVGLKKLTGDRNVENYDFERAQMLRKQREAEEGDMVEEEEGDISPETEPAPLSEEMSKRLSRKRPFQSRLYQPPPKPKPNAAPNERLDLPELTADEAPTDSQLCTNIANALQEQKPQMIAGVVEVLGRGKALEIYEETREIERNGGQVINNGERRRTSGGLFLQLVKKLPLSREEHSAIFVVDEAQMMWRRRKRAVHRRRNRNDAHSNAAASGSPSPEPASSGATSRLGGSDSSDAAAAGGPVCPGSTPVTSPAPSPGPTPTTTPIVTPHTSDQEDEAANARIVDTALAIVKAVGSDVPPLEDAPPQDEMDVF